MSRTEPAPHVGVFASCQQGATSPLSAQAGTVVSTSVPLPFP